MTTIENSRVLSGWKEVAAYLGRGVRTVQRWEKLGLPVRRPNAHLRSAVLASSDEIDRWILGCNTGRLPDGEDDSPATHEDLRAEVRELRQEVESLRRELETLKQKSNQLHQPAGKSASAPQQAA